MPSRFCWLPSGGACRADLSICSPQCTFSSPLCYLLAQEVGSPGQYGLKLCCPRSGTLAMPPPPVLECSIPVNPQREIQSRWMMTLHYLSGLLNKSIDKDHGFDIYKQRSYIGGICCCTSCGGHMREFHLGKLKFSTNEMQRTKCQIVLFHRLHRKTKSVATNGWCLYPPARWMECVYEYKDGWASIELGSGYSLAGPRCSRGWKGHPLLCVDCSAVFDTEYSQEDSHTLFEYRQKWKNTATNNQVKEFLILRSTARCIHQQVDSGITTRLYAVDDEHTHLENFLELHDGFALIGGHQIGHRQDFRVILRLTPHAAVALEETDGQKQSQQGKKPLIPRMLHSLGILVVTYGSALRTPTVQRLAYCICTPLHQKNNKNPWLAHCRSGFQPISFIICILQESSSRQMNVTNNRGHTE